MKKTADGGGIFAGFTESNDGDLAFKTTDNTDAWIVKLTASGAIDWQKVLVGNPLATELYTVANAIEQTADGGYIVCGTTLKTFELYADAEIWVAKLDSSGNTEWSTFFGDSTNSDYGSSVLQTADGGFLVMGSTTVYNASENYNEIKIALAKLASDGSLVWQKTYSDSISNFGRGMIQTTDGNYVIVGDSYAAANNYHGSRDYDFYVLKIDESGTLLWQKKYGGSGVDRAFAVAEAPDGNYVVTGFTDSTDGDVTSNNGGFDIWTLKINKN